MTIATKYFDSILALNVDEHRTACAYSYWEATFPSGTYISKHLAIIKDFLGDDFTRTEIVNFYRRSDVEAETKFISAIIWGHEAPVGSRRDGRGPWKLSKMFSDPQKAQSAIRTVSVATPEDIVSAYKLLDKTLDRCGPNFFTKHFYFTGKAQGLNPYPLIFDDRVANGLIKLALSNYEGLDVVKVSAARKPDAYLRYLSFAANQAARIGCELDQIEYYLFNL